MTRKSLTLISGPLLSIVGCYLAVMRGALHPTLLVWALATVALMWSPLPISLAAVLMDEERVTTLSEMNGARRAVLLIPAMLHGEYAQETQYHLLGFASCLIALATALAL